MKRCSKWDYSLKGASREDSHSSSTQNISTITVIFAMNLDINLLNVNYMQKGAQKATH